MKIVSWNVNGLRACVNKGFMDVLAESGADIFCLQETKMERAQKTFAFAGYEEYWNSADKKGYSGTAVLVKQPPLSVSYDMGIDEHDHEGRVITLEYGDFYLVNVYVPNSGEGLKRLSYRLRWQDDFVSYIKNLSKPVIVCGDMNVAHQEIDLKNPKTNRKNAGFTDEERQKMTELLSAGYVDSFRYIYPEAEGVYSWWSYRFHAREKNAGWRIDYVLLDNRLVGRLEKAEIHGGILGSDHCPVSVTLKE